jgi:hypothetical protein
VDATAPVESGPPADASTGDASGLPDASADAVADTGSGIDAGIVLASFALVVDGVVQTPLGCVTAPWDYAEPMQSHPHVALENTGAVPLAYNALSSWNIAPPNLPGVANGATNQLVGVLAPGAQVDITSVFTATAAGGGGIIAVLGSAAPFHSPPRSFFDEGTIPWPMGVAGSGGASTMYVVQLTDSTGCQQAFSQFW